MDYYVFCLQKEFEDVMTPELLLSIFEREHDTFYQEQMKRIVVPISWSRVMDLAKSYFANREDVSLYEYRIVHRSPFFEKEEELFGLSSCLLLRLEKEESPLKTFLLEMKEHFLFIKKDGIAF